MNTVTSSIKSYRVSHETWQLVNGFECLLSYIILDILDFFQFILLTNSFTQIFFTLKSIFYKMTAICYISNFSLLYQRTYKLWRRHLKYSPTVMFRGTPCKKKPWKLNTNLIRFKISALCFYCWFQYHNTIKYMLKEMLILKLKYN